jgi:hypothetical protein
MTQTKTGAFLFMGRLPQSIGQAALAASVLAGGASLLNAGGAMAIACAPLGNFDYSSPTYISGQPASSYSCDNPITSGGSPLAAAFDAQFSPSSTASAYSYHMTAKIGPFNAVAINADINADPTLPDWKVTYTKELFKNSDFTGPVGTLVFTETPTSSTTTGSLTDLSLTQLFVRDSFVSNNPGVGINTATNTFSQTPGPLPILGAGAAFGFSRKLRSRIKAGRTA